MFAVNVDTAESDLAPVDPDELRNEVWQGVRFTEGMSRHDSAAPVNQSSTRPRPLHVDLLYAVLGLLLLETLAGWKSGSRLT